MRKYSLLLATLIVLAVVPTDMAAKTELQTALEQAQKQLAPDKRTAIWDVSTIDQGGRPVVIGTVGTQAQKDQLDKVLSRFDGVTDNVVVLENSMPAGKRWAIVKLAVASLRCTPQHSGEMATQAVMGTPVKVLEVNGEWCRVQTPDDYISYVPESSITYMNSKQLVGWRQSKRMIVTCYGTRLVTEPSGDETVSDLVLSSILEKRGEKGKWVKLATPDGREGWVEKKDVEEFDQWAKQTYDADYLEKVARRMMGSGYLWGGTSTKVTDCSGLMKVCHLANGIILQRDASQQALTGKKIDDWHQAKLGDLLFFGNSKTGRVTHVGMYLRDGAFIHCSGQVKINNLDPNASDYLYSPLSISRIDGQIGTKGITYVRDHPWYF